MPGTIIESSGDDERKRIVEIVIELREYGAQSEIHRLSEERLDSARVRTVDALTAVGCTGNQP